MFRSDKPRRSLLIGLAGTVAMAAVVVGILAHGVRSGPGAHAATTGNDYPWGTYDGPGSNPATRIWYNPSGTSAFSPLRFNFRNCTDYVAYELNERLGGTLVPSQQKFNWSKINYNGDGDAKYWKSGAILHYGASVVSPTPALGAVAWWDSYDHVAIVASVSTDGNTIVVDDYNVNYKDAGNGLFASYPITKGSTASWMPWPDDFLHIADTHPAPTSPVPWNFETLDGDPGSVGGYNAEVGQNPTSAVYNGSLQLFYYDKQNGRLRHAWTDATGWHFEVLDGAGGSNGRTTDNVGAAMAVTTYNGTLQLFYYDATATTLRHAWSDTTGWHFETLDSSGNVGTATTVQVSGTRLQVFYPSLSTGDLRHAWRDATGWHFENLDGDNGSIAGQQGRAVARVGASLASTLDANGNIQLFYYATSSQGLRHAWADATGWHFENLDGGSLGALSGSSDAIGQNPSVVLAGSALQLFSYNATKHALRHAWTDASGWHFENLDGLGSNGPDQYDLGLYSSVVMSGTTVQLFYYDSQWGELRHAWSDANGWHFENLDGLGGLPSGRLGPGMSVGLYPSAIVYGGVPHVFYYDATNGNLRHAWSQ